MYDGIEFRGFKQETVEALAKYSGVPVWNGLTDVDHPTQTLADFLTIEEHLDKPLEDIKFVFTGDIRNNVCYGLMYGAVKMGMHFVCLGPKSLHIDPEVLAYCKEEAKKSEKVYLASDPDREGEAIAWHLSHILGIDEHEKCRIVFNEITKPAIQEAVKNPKEINIDRVDAQQARRMLDRIVGYKLSPLLWKKIRKGLSAGRVQIGNSEINL